MIEKIVKDSIVHEVRERVRIDHDKQEAACLDYALQTIIVLAEYGLNGKVQAGTVMWPRLRPEQDDGVSNTHFSYVWENDPSVKQKLVTTLMMGKLPEIHVWVALPETEEVLDFTTCFQREQCQKLTGMDWPGDELPDYIWGTVNEFPLGTQYIAHKEAIGFLITLAQAKLQVTTQGFVTF